MGFLSSGPHTPVSLLERTPGLGIKIILTKRESFLYCLQSPIEKRSNFQGLLSSILEQSKVHFDSSFLFQPFVRWRGRNGRGT